MKKIEFGYANEIDPKGSWEGIGIKHGMLLTDADYYGAIELHGNSYIVAKVVEDKYDRFPELVNNFIVRGAVADMYADGSGTLFLDQEQSFEAQQIENYLNQDLVKNKINDFSDIVGYVKGLQPANKFFTLLSMNDKVIATSITHEAFEIKNEAIKNCRQTFSEMQKSLTETRSMSK